MARIVEPGDRDYKYMNVYIKNALDHLEYWLKKKGLTKEEIRLFWLAKAKMVK